MRVNIDADLKEVLARLSLRHQFIRLMKTLETSFSTNWDKDFGR